MNYSLNSYVTKQEAEALKEMIFKRARERANAMTSDFHADIMEVARESFESKNNPFSQILTQASEKASVVKEEPVQQTTAPSALHDFVDAIEAAEASVNDVGFPQKNLFSAGANQNRVIKEQLVAAQVQNTMIEARQGLSNKKSFMGALAFLNSQAAASLLNKRAGKGLDMVI